jgi:hypothetical protein
MFGTLFCSLALFAFPFSSVLWMLGLVYLFQWSLPSANSKKNLPQSTLREVYILKKQG